MVGLRIRNNENVQDNVMGISFLRRDQLNPSNAELIPVCHLMALLGVHHILHDGGLRVKPDVVRDVLGKLDHVRVPAGNRRKAEKTKGRSLEVMGAIKKGIVVVKKAFLCFSHAIIIVMPGEIVTICTNHIEAFMV